jgi:hypothetical protein
MAALYSALFLPAIIKMLFNCRKSAFKNFDFYLTFAALWQTKQTILQH